MFLDSSIADLSCFGIGYRWVQLINDFIHKIEYQVNQKVDEYISLLDVKLGNERFGFFGVGDIGTIKAPAFDCKNPKDILKSGLGDFGIHPKYEITMSILNSHFLLVGAYMEGGQGPKTTAEGAEREGSKHVGFSIKVLGTDVTNKLRKGPETSAAPANTNATAKTEEELPSKEKSGADGKLLDMNRSFFGDNAYLKPSIPIVPGLLYIFFDAGFVLQSRFNFSYGVTTLGMDLAQMGKNISNRAKKNRDAIQQCNLDGTQCTSTPDEVGEKDSSFNSLMSTLGLSDEMKRLKNIRDIAKRKEIQKAYDDAKLTKSLFEEKLKEVNDNPNLTNIQKAKLLGQIDFTAIRGDQKKVESVVKDVNMSLATVNGYFSKAKQIASAFENGGVPEVKGDVTLSLNGYAAVWGKATLTLELVFARAWAGLTGTIVAADIIGGLSAETSTKSEYLDLKLKLDRIFLQGSLVLDYGVQVGFGEFGFKITGTKLLFEYPGLMTSEEKLIGRLDFRPLGKKMLFWCVGNNTDPERCNDGAMASNELTPYLDAHAEFTKKYLNENPIQAAHTCFLQNDGDTIFSSTDSKQNCKAHLPVDGNADLLASNTPDHEMHPLLQAANKDASFFHTTLRDDNNRPVKTYSLVYDDGSTDSFDYTSPKSAQYALNGDIIVPEKFVPEASGIYTTAGVSKRIFTVTSQGIIYVDGDGKEQFLSGDGPLAFSDPRFLIKLSNGNKVFVGHLLSLNNQELFQAMYDYKLGTCIKSRVHVEDDSCILPATGIANPTEARIACEIRKRLLSGECFPKERVTELVALGNLADETIHEYFFGPNKWITGELKTMPISIVPSPSGQVGANWVVKHYNDFYMANGPSTGSTGLSDVLSGPWGYDTFYGDTDYFQTYMDGHATCDYLNPVWAVGQNAPAHTTIDASSLNTNLNYLMYFVPEVIQDGRLIYHIFANGWRRDFGIVGADQNKSYNIAGAALSGNPSVKSRWSQAVCDPNWPGTPGNQQEFTNRLNDIKTANGTIPLKYITDQIHECISDANCRFIVEDQRSTVSSCLMAATAPNTTQEVTVLGTVGGNSVTQCVLANSNFNNAEDFCRANIQFLAPLINTGDALRPSYSETRSTIYLKAKWSQTAMSGSPFEQTLNQAQSVGVCTFSFKNGRATLVSSADSEFIKTFTQTQPGVCEVIVGKAGSPIVAPSWDDSRYAVARSVPYLPSQKLIDSMRGCEEGLGFQSALSTLYTNNASRTSVLQAKDALKVASFCNEITPQTLANLLSKEPTVTSSDPINLEMYIRLNNQVSANYADNYKSIGSCSYTKKEIQDKLAGRDMCSVRLMTNSSQGNFTSKNIPIVMPPYEGSKNASEICLAEAQRLYGTVYGGAGWCHDEFRSNPDYTSLMQTCDANNSNCIKPAVFLSDTMISYLGGTVSAPVYCGGPPKTIDEILTSNDLNKGCKIKVAANPNGIDIAINPIEKSYAYDPQGVIQNSSQCSDYWNLKIKNRVYNSTTHQFTLAKYCNDLRQEMKDNLGQIVPGIAIPTIAIPNGMGESSEGVSLGWPNKPYGLVISSNLSSQNAQYLTSNISGTQTGVARQTSTTDGLIDRLPSGKAISGWDQPINLGVCRYDFKEVATGVWDLVEESWQPDRLLASETKVTACIRDSNDQCLRINPGDTLIFAGAGGGAIEKLSTQFVSKPVDQNYIDSFCSTHYEKLVPLGDSDFSDPQKRFPVWVKVADQYGNVTEPKVTDPTQFYCKPKSCELLVEFGTESYYTQAGWRAKINTLPTSSQGCIDYYKEQVSSYCAQSLTLAQLPDNMPIDLIAVFDGERHPVGTCPARAIQRTCEIGIRKQGSFFSWLASENQFLVEKVDTASHHISFDSLATKGKMIAPIANTLQRCIELGRQINSQNAVCTRPTVANSISFDRKDGFEVSIVFGEFSEKIGVCSPGGGTVVTAPSPSPIPSPTDTPNDLEILRLTPQLLGSKCDWYFDFGGMKDGARLEVGYCRDKDCASGNYTVIGNAEAKSKFEGLPPGTWKLANDNATIGVRQILNEEKTGEWAPLDMATYLKRGEILMNDCGVKLE